MTIDVPKVRPAVLTEESAERLEPYLAFRHRFRNLYLFDLRQEIISSLLSDISPAWGRAKADIGAFATFLESTADVLEDDDESAH